MIVLHRIITMKDTCPTEYNPDEISNLKSICGDNDTQGSNFYIKGCPSLEPETVLESVNEIRRIIKDAKEKEGIEMKKNSVFLIHGHDLELKNLFLDTVRNIDENIKVIILGDKPGAGLTIIEKFEKYADKVCCAVALLSPDDIGFSAKESKQKARARARQNVIGELFYFAAKLGRSKVVAIKKGDIEWPSDFSGIHWIDPSETNFGLKLSNEFKAMGLNK